MSRVAFTTWVAAAGLAAAGAAGVQLALAAKGDEAAQRVAEATGDFGEPVPLAHAANLTMRFIQEDGPESGHVRVVLTPEVRPLTILEARSAAQQAFLETLKERGLGDNLKRITVVVRLMPKSHPDPAGAEQVIVYLHKGGRDWSVRPGE